MSGSGRLRYVAGFPRWLAVHTDCRCYMLVTAEKRARSVWRESGMDNYDTTSGQALKEGLDDCSLNSTVGVVQVD